MSNANEELVKAYCEHYLPQNGGSLRSFQSNQIGGMLPSFQGTQYQRGHGLGDILRGIFRTVFPLFAPIATNSASTFIKSAGEALIEGKTLKDAAKSAFAPTAGALIDSTARTLKSQIGNGKGKYKRKKKAYKRKGKNNLGLDSKQRIISNF